MQAISFRRAALAACLCVLAGASQAEGALDKAPIHVFGALDNWGVHRQGGQYTNDPFAERVTFSLAQQSDVRLDLWMDVGTLPGFPGAFYDPLLQLFDGAGTLVAQTTAVTKMGAVCGGEKWDEVCFEYRRMGIDLVSGLAAGDYSIALSGHNNDGYANSYPSFYFGVALADTPEMGAYLAAVSPMPVPEPSSGMLMGLGLVMGGLVGRRVKMNQAAAQTG